MRYVLCSMLVVAGGCDLVLSLDRGASGDANVVFVTSGVHDGAFGGLDGIDEMCRVAANTVNLRGQFVGWASASGVSASSRLADSRGWVLLDGRVVTDLPGELAVSGPRVPIALTEIEGDIRPSNAAATWTATNGDGSTASSHCLDWTSNDSAESAVVGDASQGGSAFSNFATRFCDEQHHVFCFEIGKSVELPLETPQGPIAFVSEGRLQLTTGRIAADDLCATEATNASLSGTFLALLSTSTETAIERFTPNLEYVRVDGVRFGNITSPLPETFLNITAKGDLLPKSERVWTGGDPTSKSSADCGEWFGVGMGGVGFAQMADTRAYSAGSQPCDQANHVYCFQQ